MLFVLSWRVGHNEVIGVCRVGSYAESLGRDHWCEMLTYPRKPIARWHTLVEVKSSIWNVVLKMLCDQGQQLLPYKTLSNTMHSKWRNWETFLNAIIFHFYFAHLTLNMLIFHSSTNWTTHFVTVWFLLAICFSLNAILKANNLLITF